MSAVSVHYDIQAATRWLSDLERNQVPFASAVAITRTAKAVEADLRTEIPQVFDRPTPFVAKGTFSTSAKKNDPVALVGMRDMSRRGAAPADYVREHFFGGVRDEKPFERAMRSMGALPAGWRAVPGEGMKLDANGNPNRRALSEVFGALATGMSINTQRGRKHIVRRRVGYFVVRPGTRDARAAHLPPGIWRRIHSDDGYEVVQPVFLFVQQAHYDQVIDLAAMAGRTVDRVFRHEFEAAMTRALSTAR